MVPIYREDSKGLVMARADEIVASLKGAGLRVRLDADDTKRPGEKYAHWELRGVPIRIELGPRDLEENRAVLVRRDTREKISVPLTTLEDSIRTLLNDIQSDLYEAARTRLVDRTRPMGDYGEFRERIESERGFFLAGWDGDPATEAKVKEETKATIRCLPNNLAALGIEAPSIEGTNDPVSGAPAKHLVVYARSY
jgi:prolyl-tRNA synthetase